MMSSMTCDVFCALAFCREAQSRKFKILECLLFRVSNVMWRKAREAIDVRRRIVFFSLRANVYTGIRGVVLVVVVACAIFYLSKTRSIFAFIFIVVVVVVSWYYYSRW